MTGSITKLKKGIETCNAAQPGYDQSQRWTFYDGTKRLFIKGKESDCSSTVAAIVHWAGYPINIKGTCYTGNLNELLVKAGFKQITFKSTKDVKPGDVINAPGKHVEICYGTRSGQTGTWWYSARNDEKGGQSGGKAGDQGGRENVGWGRPYDMSKGGSRKAYILRPPAPAAPVVDKTKPADFRFGAANLQAERFGGLDDSSTARAKFMQDKMKCSVYALSEMSEEARTATRKAHSGGADRWKVQEVGYVCVFWDSTKWLYTTDERVGFGTSYHGAVRQCLQRKDNGQKIDVISIHVRPNDALTGSDDDKLKTKLADIQKGLNLVRKDMPTVFAGDFNTSHARKYITDRGFKAVNDHIDTVDKAGDQKLDGIYVNSKIPIRDWSVVDPGSVSDHKTLVGNLTVPGASSSGGGSTT